MNSRRRFLLFTKTPWEELPRLRHQVARLISQAGYEVVFFERPQRGGTLPPPRFPEPRIVVVRHHELVHHRLRITSQLQDWNRRHVVSSVRRVLRDLGKPPAEGDVVVNFNYDYWFLREAACVPSIVTIINDDFVNGAVWGSRAASRDALARTCRSSHRVLTVSAPLQRSLAPYVEAELFLPWATSAFDAPRTDQPRDTLLFWGFINYKLDFDLLNRAASTLRRQAPGLKILLAGPREGRVDRALATLIAAGNVEIAPPTELEHLPLARTLAALIPYRTGSPDIDAIMLPNKALQLLSRGLPLMIAGMPDFIKAPFVFRFQASTAASVAKEIAGQYTQLQPFIRAFVEENGPQSRLSQLLAATSA